MTHPTIATIDGLALPRLETGHRLQRLLQGSLQQQGVKPPSQSALPYYWDADFWGLTAVDIFQDATSTEKGAILTQASHSLLTESYWIEQVGIGYMAKMVLQAETVEERMMYSLFGADETTHLAQLQSFLPEIPKLGEAEPFLQLLADIVNQDDRSVLLFVIQVVLEGWGLSHYRQLGQKCLYPPLKQIFNSFLQAEARHHKSGKFLFAESQLSAAKGQRMVDILAQFLSLIRVGPQQLLMMIVTGKQGLTRSQKLRIMEQLKTEEHSGQRLELLRSLMLPFAPGVVERLADRGLFAPLPASECV
jgi:hypothetical protein